MTDETDKKDEEIAALKADLQTLWEAIWDGRSHLDIMYPPSRPHITNVRLKHGHEGNNKALGLYRMIRRAQEMTDKYPHLQEAAKEIEAAETESA